MARRKIRHALVQYSVTEDDGVTRFETVFRNQIVDIPEDQVERLDELGATVDPDAPLERPGVMNVLPETASDSEIFSWVIGATDTEVEALISERPVMAGRILSAQASVRERFEEQNRHLGGRLQEVAEQHEADEQAKAAELEALLGGDDDGAGDSSSDNGETPGEDVTSLSDEDADKIVDGKVEDVADYIAKNPSQAQVILDAEGRRATAKNVDVRVTVIKAAEAAVGFTQ